MKEVELGEKELEEEPDRLPLITGISKHLEGMEVPEMISGRSTEGL